MYLPRDQVFSGQFLRENNFPQMHPSGARHARSVPWLRFPHMHHVIVAIPCGCVRIKGIN